MIHSTAIVSNKAIIEEGVKIGAFSIIEEDVRIGRDTRIMEGVIVRKNTRIGKRNIIFPHAVIGEVPQDVKYKGEKTYTIIGDGNIIREFVTIHRACGKGKKTEIGDNNYIMAYSHIGHNARVGNGAILVNGTTLGGYAEIMDFAYISAHVSIHQFTKVGEYTIIGGGYRVTKDVVPYAMAAGEPLKIYGINREGLRRHGFERKKLEILKECFRILFRSSLNTSQAVEKIEMEIPPIEEVRRLLDFIKQSKRGIVK